MRKIAVVLALCFSLSGCIDIFQHVTRDGNGVDQNVIKLTISKSILDMANSRMTMGAGEPIDYGEWLDESGREMRLDEYDEFSASVEAVNDETDIGYLIKMNLDYRNKKVIEAVNGSTIGFIPRYEKNTITIHIDAFGSDPDDDEMMDLFLSSAKYRLLVSKKCAGSITKVVLETNDGQTEVGCIDVNDGYLVEIPMIRIFGKKARLVIYTPVS